MSVNDDLKGKQFTRLVDGHELTASVSPCVWMYPNYGLQVEIVLKDSGNAFLNDKDVKWGAITDAHITGLLDKAGLCKCSKPGCKNMAFDPTTIDTNRAGKCEACFMEELNIEFEKEIAKQKAKDERLDAKYKTQGYTHKVVAWVHPQAGGDDYQMAYYFKGKPLDDEIKKELSKKRSAVDNDYQITEL